MEKQITNEESTFFQAYSVLKLMFELNDKNFLQSDYFKENFPNDNELYKYVLHTSGIVNSGTILLLFYAILVFPKETLSPKLQENFQTVDRTIENLRPRCKSTYDCDKSNIKYVRHIRNAIAHGKFNVSNNSVEFRDNNKSGESFSLTFSLAQLSCLATHMQTSIVGGLYKG